MAVIRPARPWRHKHVQDVMGAGEGGSIGGVGGAGHLERVQVAMGWDRVGGWRGKPNPSGLKSVSAAGSSVGIVDEAILGNGRGAGSGPPLGVALGPPLEEVGVSSLGVIRRMEERRVIHWVA